MKRFLAFVRKEFFHILRDPRTMLILLGMPIIQIILFGFAISVEIKGINIAIVAPEQSTTINELTEKINANDYFSVVSYSNTPDKALNMLQKGDADIILQFPTDFSRKIANNDISLQIISDGSNPNTAVAQENYLQQIIASYFREHNSSNAPTQSINIDIHLMYNPGMESSYNFVPGIMGLIMIIICAMMTSVSIVREKEMGTMEVLLVTPMRPIGIIFSKMIPYFVLSLINLAIILLLSKYLLGVPLAGSIFWICTISIIYIILSLALGLLISTIVSTQAAAMLCSAMVLLLPVLMLSGMIFPIDSAPKFFQGLSCGIPATWYISAMRKLMVEGLQVKYVVKEMFILLAMSIALIGIALANFKNRL